MPVSVVVGGQFGSEGKGKVALELARRSKESHVIVVRVGGSNSGHTGYTKDKRKYALRQLPAGCIDRNVDVVFPAGSYIDVNILLEEIELLQYPKDRIFISPYARIISDEHKLWEAGSKLGRDIGSTGSGVGAAVLASVARGAQNFPLSSLDAQHCETLSAFVCDTSERLRKWLSKGSRVIIEGSQGFGLSLLEGGYWPKATSRSTTAAAALSEAGLSPLDVDEVVMVLRSYPIRVAGESGPLFGETTWEEIARRKGSDLDLREYTTVTKKLRRVGVFDVKQVKHALDVNKPNILVMNHLDYIGKSHDLDNTESELSKFIVKTQDMLGQSINFFGFSPFDIFSANKIFV
ncbi:adenylosuccinate synthetase [Hellea balneolensis]|uniref:adenylosuccinate synthetase n=1 Tax=Hellea balneolensis TaxID=287478 RepID=UPI000405C0EB|nr:adenylosuccinate synthetase [Hellea balneolensis]